MFVLRSSISVEVSKKIFEIINKREDPNKHWGMPGKNSKINKRGGPLFGTQECILLQCVFLYGYTIQ